MDESTERQPQRASLRGRGREILLGQRADGARQPEATERPEAVDPGSLRLTASEVESLLDMAEVFEDGESPFPVAEEDHAVPDIVAVEDEIPPEQAAETLDAAYEEQAGEPEEIAPDPAPLEPVLEEEDPAAAGLEIPDEVILPTLEDEPETVEASVEEDATGLVDAGNTGEQDDVPLDFADVAAAFGEESDLPDGDPVVMPAPEDVPAPEIPGPPVALVPLVQGYDMGLAAIIDDERVRRLLEQIEALQDDLAQAPEFDPAVADGWQRQLFEASALLLQSRANYEAARMVATGIQTEMSRQRRVRADVLRYRPLLLNYYVGWGIAWVVLMALKSMVVGVTESIGLDIVAAYTPVLFGVLGAVVAGYLALERHAVRLRDFDPLYITGYVINPLLGGVAGLLAFLLFGIANHRVLDNTADDLERIMLWGVCVVVGMNQSAILRRAGSLFRREDARR